MRLGDFEYAVNNPNGKNAFERVSVVEDKRANLGIFVTLMWMPILKGLLFFCHLGFTRGVARGVGEAEGQC